MLDISHYEIVFAHGNNKGQGEVKVQITSVFNQRHDNIEIYMYQECFYRRYVMFIA